GSAPAPRRPWWSRAGIERGRVARLAATLAERGVERLLPRAVLEGGREGLVDELAQLGAVLAVADAGALLREGLADDLELVGILGGVAQQDRRIRGDRVDGAVEQLVHALGVGVEAGRRGAELLLHRLDRGRAGDGADLLAVEVLGALDRVVVL